MFSLPLLAAYEKHSGKRPAPVTDSFCPSRGLISTVVILGARTPLTLQLSFRRKSFACYNLFIFNFLCFRSRPAREDLTASVRSEPVSLEKGRGSQGNTLARG